MSKRPTIPTPSSLRRVSTRPALAGLCLALLMAPGCDSLKQKSSTAPNKVEIKSVEKAKAPPPPTTRESLSDADIKYGVMHRLFGDAVFPTVSVQVNVKDGIVELSGAAFSLFAKQQAENIVRTTKGVRGYVDEMTVVETDITDEALKVHVDDALLLDPATESYEVKTKVKNGAVELTGEVDSWAEYGLAADVVAAVMGVREVDNLLTVKTPPVRTEGEIQAEILQRLKNDVRIDAAMVDVKVKDGVVTLEGIVGSADEQARAMENAWVSGVARVESDLLVEWWERDRFVSYESEALVPDIEIRTAVVDALAYDARVNDDDIEVYVDRGRVTLLGTVPSVRSKKKAAETALNARGATRVRNYIQVDPKDDLDDEQLRERVLRALRFNPYLSSWTGKVSAENGVVYLEGTVNTERQKRQAENVAARVLGVAHIENNLTVYLQEMADLALEEDVKEALSWNVYLDKGGIDVATRRGMVTLSGKVDNLRDYREAAASARAAGAEVVFNQLKIGPKTRPKQPEGPGDSEDS